jgi:ligand-binding sensor domain-containing protein
MRKNLLLTMMTLIIGASVNAQTTNPILPTYSVLSWNGSKKLTFDKDKSIWLTNSFPLTHILSDTSYTILSDPTIPARVTCQINVDSKGNKWIGTGSSIVKYDGTTYTEYLNSSWVSKVNTPNFIMWQQTIDKNDIIWQVGYSYETGGTTTAIIQFNPATQTKYLFPFKANVSQNFIYVDTLDNKWVGTQDSGLYKLSGTTWTRYTTSNSSIPSNRIYSMTMDNQGVFWIGTDMGLAKFTGSTWTTYNKTNSLLPDNNITAITIDSINNKWIGTKAGMAKYTGTKWTKYFLPNSLTTQIVDLKIQKGLLYVLTDVVLLTYNMSSTWKVYDNFDKALNNINIDKNNKVWAGFHKFNTTTSNAGNTIVKFDRNIWTIYDSVKTGISSTNNITCIKTSKSGDVWVGTGSGLIYKYNGSVWTSYNLPLPVNAIAFDNNDSIWVGVGAVNNPSNGGVYHYDKTKKAFIKMAGTQNQQYITALAFDKNNTLWVGGSSYDLYNAQTAKSSIVRGGLYKYGSTNFITGKYNEISSIDFTSNGLIWASNYGSYTGNQTYSILGGVEAYDNVNKTWTYYDNLTSQLTTANVYFVAVDKVNNVWVGQVDQLLKLDSTGGGTTYTSSKSIAFDSNNAAWVPFTNYGFPGYKVYNLKSNVVTSTNSLDKESSMEYIFPNPYNGTININSNNPSEISSMEILDVTGRTVFKADRQNISIENQIVTCSSTGLENHPAGIYFVLVQSGNRITIHKLIKE